jgi:hypothetical protein
MAIFHQLVLCRIILGRRAEISIGRRHEVLHMHRSASLILIFLFQAAALSQTTPTDSQTLQALLAEVRLLRHDANKQLDGCEGTNRPVPTAKAG